MANEGTKIHAALESGDKSDLDLSQVEIAERLQSMESEAYGDWLETVPECERKSVQMFREIRCWGRNHALDPIFSAKPDVIYATKRSALVINYKTGFKDAPPAHLNWQSRTEALAVWHEFGKEMTSIRVAIAQYRFTDKMTVCDYSGYDLEMAFNDLMRGIWASQQKDAPLVPGHWCKYCPGKPYCRPYAAYSLLFVTLDHNCLSNQDLAMIERRRGAAEDLFSSVKERLKKLSEPELGEIGFKLRPGKEIKSVPDVMALFLILQEHGLVTHESFLSACKVSVPKLEDLVVEQIKKVGDKKLSSESYDKVFGKLTTGLIASKQSEKILKDIS